MPKDPQKTISNKRKALEKRREKIDEEQDKLIKSCTHPNAEMTRHRKVDNVNPCCSYYWTGITCPDCGGRWHGFKDIDGDEQNNSK